jgi:asparagine synthetase B (glutamine-hydrolysing)
VNTFKQPLPADEFLKEVKFEKTLNQGTMSFIGHARYSTSDLEFNQPISDSTLALVHNGVVTQADPSQWKEKYGMNFLTRNDSEILFNYLKKGQWPDTHLNAASEAWFTLDSTNKMLAYRNGKRPLWYALFYDFKKAPHGTVVASTRNILLRSIRAVEYPYTFELFQCSPGTVYKVEAGSVTVIDTLPDIKEWQRNYERKEIRT